jgi:hypothetical protein
MNAFESAIYVNKATIIRIVFCLIPIPPFVVLLLVALLLVALFLPPFALYFTLLVLFFPLLLR